MKFCVYLHRLPRTPQSPVSYRPIRPPAAGSDGQSLPWIAKYVRPPGDTTLCNLCLQSASLYSLWESVHYTSILGKVTYRVPLLEYCAPSQPSPRPSPSIIHDALPLPIAPSAMSSRCSLPDRPASAMAFFAAKAHGPRPPRTGHDPIAGESAQTHIVPLSGMKVSALLVHFPHARDLGHRGLDASARANTVCRRD